MKITFYLSKVTAKYETCNNTTDICMCGLYLETKEGETKWSYAFVDGCGSNKKLNVKFMNYANNMGNVEKTGYHFELNCSSTIKDELDENEWSNVPIRNNNFKCARLNTTDSCLTYLVMIINFFLLYALDLEIINSPKISPGFSK